MYDCVPSLQLGMFGWTFIIGYTKIRKIKILRLQYMLMIAYPYKFYEILLQKTHFCEYFPAGWVCAGGYNHKAITLNYYSSMAIIIRGTFTQ